MDKTKPHPDLEACVGKNTTVTVISRDQGIQPLSGVVGLMNFPWFVQFKERILLPGGKVENTFDFAGPTNGILKVELDGRTVYNQERLPRPYHFLSLAFPSDEDELNAMRRTLFGPGFDY